MSWRVSKEIVLSAIRDCVMVSASPIGPLHGAGWNDAINAVLKHMGEI